MFQLSCKPIKFADYDRDLLTNPEELIHRLGDYYICFRKKLKEEYDGALLLELSEKQLKKSISRYEDEYTIYTCTKGLHGITITKLFALLLISIIRNKVVYFSQSTPQKIIAENRVGRINCIFGTSFIKDYMIPNLSSCSFISDITKNMYDKFTYELESTLEGNINPMHIAFALDAFIKHSDNIYL